MRDLKSELEALAERGERRGSAEVLRRARVEGTVPFSYRPSRRRLLVVSGVILVVVALITYGVSGKGRHGASVTTTSGSTIAAPNSVATSPSVTTAATAPPSAVLTVPPRTDVEAPLNAQLQRYLLMPGDWPGSMITTLTGAETYGSRGQAGVIGQFSPCGYPFDDSTAASGRATVTLANLGPSVDSSGLLYVYEDIAAFTLAQAQRVFSGFRQQADSCPHYPGLGGHQDYIDVPFVNGVGTGWAIAPVSVPALGDEDGAVEIAKSDRGYVLVVIRKGRYLAFLRILDSLYETAPEPARTLNTILAAAASRIPSA